MILVIDIVITIIFIFMLIMNYSYKNNKNYFKCMKINKLFEKDSKLISYLGYLSLLFFIMSLIEIIGGFNSIIKFILLIVAMFLMMVTCVKYMKDTISNKYTDIWSFGLLFMYVILFIFGIGPLEVASNNKFGSMPFFVQL